MSLLDRYDEIQRRPFGTNTALSDGSQYGPGGSAGSQLRRQESAYGQALRILNRQARRGDANSALRAIQVRDQAMADGYSPGGIRRRDEANAGIMGRIQQMEEGAARRNRATQLYDQQSGLDPGMTSPTTPTQQDATDPGFTKPNRVGAALDILEGNFTSDLGGGYDQMGRGYEQAYGLGVQNPETILQGDTSQTYRRTLDQALGQAQTPQEIDALRDRGTRFGVPVDAFNARAKWWEQHRTRRF